MSSIERIRIALVLLAVFSFVSFALLARSANAQTMGEYGMAVGHAATSSGSMPRMSPPSSLPPPSAGRNPRGPSHTVTVRTYDEPEPHAANSDRNDTGDDSADSAGSHDDWEQVK